MRCLLKRGVVHEEVHGPGSKRWSMDRVQRGGPWTGFKEVVHGPGPQGWSMVNVLYTSHNQWWHSKREHNISARAVTCAHNKWQKHYTNLKHLLQQSIAHKIDVEILKEKYKNISVVLQQLTCKINVKIYFLQEPKKSASTVALLQNQL